jgi:hypothetical protein
MRPVGWHDRAAMDEILGLPAHPLLVHGAVVLVPLAAAGVALIAFWPAARYRLGYAVLAIAAAGAMTAVLAQRSGEYLEDRVRETELIEEHTELGETGTKAGIAVLVAALAVVVTDVALRRRASNDADATTPNPTSRAPSIVVGIVALVLATGGAIQVARIGHSGAKAVWNATTDEVDEDNDNSGPGNSNDRDD